jgi:hypothetical protein
VTAKKFTRCGYISEVGPAAARLPPTRNDPTAQNPPLKKISFGEIGSLRAAELERLTLKASQRSCRPNLGRTSMNRLPEQTYWRWP